MFEYQSPWEQTGDGKQVLKQMPVPLVAEPAKDAAAPKV
jgi:hypothetical protein